MSLKAALLKNNCLTDCYFYLNSTCTKGNQCPFRHSLAPLKTKVVCKYWKKNKCYDFHCRFRHSSFELKGDVLAKYRELSKRENGVPQAASESCNSEEQIRIKKMIEESSMIYEQEAAGVSDTMLSEVQNEVPVAAKAKRVIRRSAAFHKRRYSPKYKRCNVPPRQARKNAVSSEKFGDLNRIRMELKHMMKMYQNEIIKGKNEISTCLKNNKENHGEPSTSTDDCRQKKATECSEDDFLHMDFDDSDFELE